LDPCTLAFGLPITGDMSVSGIENLPVYRNQCYLTPEWEALNRDYEYL
jgi:hypothetical protein